MITECELPVGCRIITIFLTDEELSEVAPLDSLARHHCKVTDFSVYRDTDRDVKYSTNSTKQSTSIMKRRLICPNFSVPAVPQTNLHLYEQSKAHHSKQESVAVDKRSWNVTSRLSLSHVPIVECKRGESPGDSDREILSHIAIESHDDHECYTQVESAINCENEQSESNSETEDMVSDSNTSSKTRTNQDKPTADQIEPHSESLTTQAVSQSEQCIQTLQSKENLHTPDKPVMLSTKCGSKRKTECKERVSQSENNENSLKVHVELSSRTGEDKAGLLAEMEDNQSDKLNRSTETIYQRENTSTDELDLDISEKTNSGDIVSKSLEITLESQSEQHAKETENPSISDLEEDTDEDVSVNKTGIEDPSLTSSSKDCKTENEVASAVGLFTSSDEGANARFYDHIHDDQTKTLKKTSNHAVHQHVVDVHVASNNVSGSESINVSDDQSGLEKLAISFTSSSGNSGDENGESVYIHSVTREYEQISAASTDSLDTIKINESESSNSLAITLDNTDIKVVANGKNDDKLHEVKHINKGEVENGQMLHCIRNGKENLNPNILVSNSLVPDIHSNLSESEFETEDESVSIATIEPCINCLDLASQAKEKHGSKMIRCSQCIAKFNKQQMFGAFRNDQEILDFGGRNIDRFE